MILKPASDRQLPFTAEEHAERVNRIKASMAREEIEVLCDSDAANIYYATGYDALSYYTPQMMVIMAERTHPILILREMDVLAAEIRTYLPSENILGWPDALVDNEDRHPFELVASFLGAGYTPRDLAVETQAGLTTAHDIRVLERELGFAPRDANRLIHRVRAVKTNAEIAYIKQAARITENVMRAGLQAVKPGIRECDVIAEIYKAQMLGTSQFGGGYTANPPLILVGGASATPHLSWSDLPIPANQNLTLELSGSRFHYHCPLARTAYVGTSPPAAIDDATKYAIEGIEHTLRSIEPGMTASHVHAAWESVNSKRGLGKTSRVGYSVGCAFPPSWLERTISLRANESARLQPNMTFHLIAGIWKDTWGVEVSETFRVTTESAELLCDFERGLYLVT